MMFNRTSASACHSLNLIALTWKMRFPFSSSAYQLRLFCSANVPDVPNYLFCRYLFCDSLSLPERTGRNLGTQSLVRNISHKFHLGWGWGGIWVIDSQWFLTTTDLFAFDCLWGLLLPLWLRWKPPLLWSIISLLTLLSLHFGSSNK